MPDLKSRNNPLGIGQRTRKNLEYIKDARKRQEDVHLVTQLVNSLLGLVVLPWERNSVKSIEKVKLEELRKKGWPEWCITLDEDKEKTETLGQLVQHIRNATAHGHITFSSDSLCLSEVVIEVANKRRGAQEPHWRAKIQGDHLYSFCLLFSKYIEDTIG